MLSTGENMFIPLGRMTDRTIWEEAVLVRSVEFDRVISAIKNWHAKYEDYGCPSSGELLYGRVLTRVGESCIDEPYKTIAKQCRVVMGCGNVYTLAIEYDDDGDPSGTPSFRVEKADIVA